MHGHLVQRNIIAIVNTITRDSAVGIIKETAVIHAIDPEAVEQVAAGGRIIRQHSVAE